MRLVHFCLGPKNGAIFFVWIGCNSLKSPDSEK